MMKSSVNALQVQFCVVKMCVCLCVVMRVEVIYSSVVQCFKFSASVCCISVDLLPCQCCVEGEKYGYYSLGGHSTAASSRYPEEPHRLRLHITAS